MADIPSGLTKFNTLEISDNAPASEATFYKMGSAINYLVDFFKNTPVGMAYFSANGTWTAPSNVSLVIAYGIGGGGAGAGSNGNYNGGGGGSGISQLIPCPVTPGQAYAVRVGAGASAPGANSNGGNGQATTFGIANQTPLATFLGGEGGGQQSGIISPGRGGASGGLGLPAPNIDGGLNWRFGGIGGGGWGLGGVSSTVAGGSAPANTGGGGAGGGTNNDGSFIGGAGGSGALYLVWFTQA